MLFDAQTQKLVCVLNGLGDYKSKVRSLGQKLDALCEPMHDFKMTFGQKDCSLGCGRCLNAMAFVMICHYSRRSALCAIATSQHSLRYCHNKMFLDQSLASAYHYSVFIIFIFCFRNVVQIRPRSRAITPISLC